MLNPLMGRRLERDAPLRDDDVEPLAPAPAG